jgi:hypothetical protein
MDEAFQSQGGPVLVRAPGVSAARQRHDESLESCIADEGCLWYHALCVHCVLFLALLMNREVMDGTVSIGVDPYKHDKPPEAVFSSSDSSCQPSTKARVPR